MALPILAVHVGFLQGLFGTVALDPLHWAAAAGVASLALGTGELDKAVRRRRDRRRIPKPTRDRTEVSR
ncbi:hypothetical protein JCM10369A_44150 [Nocardioides pyridinolyticus]